MAESKLSEDDVKRHLEVINAEYKFNFPHIKEEQVSIITSILNEEDTIGVLPTGYGKTFCIIAPLLIKKRLHPQVKHTTVVVSPLVALMKEQVQNFREHGIKASMLSSLMTTEENKEVSDGTLEVIFTSPESILNDKWRRLIPKIYGQQLLLVVYDEAHCISEWGLDFRPDYKRVCELQNILVATTLVLTATASRDIVKDLEKDLCLDNYRVVSTLTNRTNIFMQKVDITENIDALRWVADHVRNRGENSKKIVIFTDSVLATAKIHEFLEDMLDDDAFYQKLKSSNHRIIEMYSAGTEHRDQERIYKRFVELNGTLRVVVATVAFGLGISIADIDIVVQWGLPRSPLQFWQQVGRAGRDGRKALSVSYIFKRSINLCKSKEMKSFASKESGCLRQNILQNFCINEAMVSQLEDLQGGKVCPPECDTEADPATWCSCPNCSCCSICMEKCPRKIESVVEAFLKL